MEFLTPLAQTSTLGLLLAITIFALYKKDQQITLLQEKRIADIKEFRDKIMPVLKKIQDTAELTFKKIDGGKNV